MIHQILNKRRLAEIKPIVFNPILERVLDYASTNSITTPTRRILRQLNAYCNAMEANGILAHTGSGGIPTDPSDFTTSDVFLNFAYDNIAFDEFSLIDWVRLVEADVFGGMAFTLEGWEGNGVDGYMDTLYNPAAGNNSSLDNCAKLSIIYRVFGAEYVIQGISANVTTNNFGIRNSIGHYHNSNANTLSSAFDFSGTGLKVMSRANSSDVLCVNKSIQGSRTQTTSTLNSSNNFTLFRRGTNFSENGISDFIITSHLLYAQTQQHRIDTNNYLRAIGLNQFA